MLRTLAHPDDLNAAVDFDSPFRITMTGAVQTASNGRPAPLAAVTAPDLVLELDEAGSIRMGQEADMLDALAALGWEPVGSSGQYGHSGPIMHASEQLAGGLARDVLDTPGVYVVTSVETIRAAASGEWDENDTSGEPAGWILLRRLDALATP